jgi:hypothetical protein
MQLPDERLDTLKNNRNIVKVKASQDIGCFYLLFITFYLMGRAGIIMEKKGKREPGRYQRHDLFNERNSKKVTRGPILKFLRVSIPFSPNEQDIDKHYVSMLLFLEDN